MTLLDVNAGILLAIFLVIWAAVFLCVIGYYGHKANRAPTDEQEREQ